MSTRSCKAKVSCLFSARTFHKHATKTWPHINSSIFHNWLRRVPINCFELHQKKLLNWGLVSEHFYFTSGCEGCEFPFNLFTNSNKNISQRCNMETAFQDSLKGFIVALLTWHGYIWAAQRINKILYAFLSFQWTTRTKASTKASQLIDVTVKINRFYSF